MYNYHKESVNSIYLKVNRKMIKKTMMEQYGHTWTEPYTVKYPEQKPQVQKSASSKYTRKSRPFCDNLREFTTYTTLHGFRYLMNRKYSKIERLWWLMMVICSILVCAFFIGKIWIKQKENPVVIHFDDTSTSVWHIPFPAVTVCSETKPRKRIFNYTKAYYERWSDPSTISKEDLKLYNDMLMVCNNDRNDGPDFANTSSIETLRKLTPSLEETFLACLWADFSCDQLFYQTLTKDGYCFTFNMFSAEEMFRMENLHKDYQHVTGQNRSFWKLRHGYNKNASVDTFPLRGLSYDGVEFEIILLTDLRDLDLICRGPIQGFKMWLHNPAELPNMGQNFVRIPIKYQSAVAITPHMTRTAEELRQYPPAQRRCYFSDERYLSFFRTYTERNCELECASNFTSKRCGCVPLYMPHGPETQVCGGGKAKCIRNALEELSLMKSNLHDETRNAAKCECLHACTELKYNADVSQAVYDLTIYKESSNPDIAQGWRVPSGLVIYFSEQNFTSLRRSELRGSVDFLAKCGGILGLFMGFSLLSLTEIIFYFTLRLWCRIRKSKFIYNAENKSRKKQ